MNKQLRFLLTLLAFVAAQMIFAQKGDLFRILNDEYSAINTRYSIIREAQKEILFSTFIIKGDAIGHAKLKMLIDASKRGVTVKVLLDDLGNKVPEEMLLYVAEQGVQIKIFNRKQWVKPSTIMRRMHGKMLIVDSTYCLVGGRNADNEYFQMDAVSNFLDREVLVRGSRAVGNARQHFDAMWVNEQISKPLEGTLTDDMRQKCQQDLQAAFSEVQRAMPKLRALRAPDTLNFADATRPTVSPVNFIHANFTYKKNGKLRRSNRSDRRVTQELLELIASADRSIDIEAAYFLPTRRWMKALRAAHARGVRIRVMTNSAISNDLPIIQAVYCNKRRKYRRAGIELYEYCGKRMVHVKAITIDDQIAAIGSYNIERKSERLNTEVMAWVNDPFQAQNQKTLFERNLAKCKRPREKCPPAYLPLDKEQKKRHRKVVWMQYTIAPFASFVF